MSASQSSRMGNLSGSFGGKERSRFRRVVLVAAVSGLLVVLGAAGWIAYEMQQASKGKTWAASRFGLQTPVQNHLQARFADANKDLVADTPAAGGCIRPETLRFSFIPDADTPHDMQAWQPLVDRLAQRIGMPVEYLPVDDVAQQLAAIKNGTLHIAGLNTGSVPLAVDACGYVPVSAKASAEGDFTVRMKFLVPAKSGVTKVAQIKKGYFTFTSNNSNSGCKMAIVTLLKEFGMMLGRDYDYRFSTSHDESIRLIAAGEIEMAAVASDMLDRAIEDGRIRPEQFREVFASEPLPAAAFGYVYNLAPDIAEKVKSALIDMDLSGTPWATSDNNVPPPRMVAIDYQKDFASIRDVDDVLGKNHDVGMLDTTATPEELAEAASESLGNSDDLDKASEPNAGAEAVDLPSSGDGPNAEAVPSSTPPDLPQEGAGSGDPRTT